METKPAGLQQNLQLFCKRSLLPWRSICTASEPSSILTSKAGKVALDETELNFVQMPAGALPAMTGSVGWLSSKSSGLGVLLKRVTLSDQRPANGTELFIDLLFAKKSTLGPFLQP